MYNYTESPASAFFRPRFLALTLELLAPLQVSTFACGEFFAKVPPESRETELIIQREKNDVESPLT